MKKYVKNPEVVEAIRFSTNNEPGDTQMNRIVTWLRTNGIIAAHNGTDVVIDLPSGKALLVSVGDWILIRGDGTVYIATNQYFESHFYECLHEWEPVEDENYDHCLICRATRPAQDQSCNDYI